MATRFTNDDKSDALILFAANYPEWDGGWAEYQFWKARSYAAIPWGKDRDTAIQAVASTLGVTVNASSPWLREQQFWQGYLAKPPTAAPPPGPVSGTILSADTFSRADNGGTAGSTDGGGLRDPLVWTPGPGDTFGIVSNQLYAPVVSNADLTVNLGTADADITVRFNVADVNNMGIMCRYTDNQNYLYWTGCSNQQMGLFKKVAGAPSAVVSGVGGFMAAGDTLRVIVSGNTYTLYRNAVLVTTQTDATFNTVTRFGIRLQSNGHRADDWMARVP